jgi:hypothetical protein
MRRKFSIGWKIAAPVYCVTVFPCQASAEVAPKNLHNKTVSISWTDSFVEKRQSDGLIRKGGTVSQEIVYISSAGRLFVRWSRGNGQWQLNHDTGPENAEADTMVFHKGTVVGFHKYGPTSSLVSRITASFDSNLSTCTASVIYGKAGGGPRTWTSHTGEEYEVEQLDVISATCDIKEGNAFAS